MTPKLTVHPAARTDIAEAAQWYETQRSTLGVGFLDELDRLLARIADNPLQSPVVQTGVRRGLLRRFPFAVYFLAQKGHVEVIAVLHLRRKPGMWETRG